jgi:DNA recombination protein RmuC
VLLTGPFGGLTEDVREFLDLPDAAQLGFVFAAGGKASTGATGRRVPSWGAFDIPARMSPSPAWFALTGTTPALIAAAAMSGSRAPCFARGGQRQLAGRLSQGVGSVPANSDPYGEAGRVGWEAVVIGLLAGAVAGLAFGRWGRPGDGGGGRELDRRLAGISDNLDRRLVDLDRRLYLGLDSVQDAQARAADTAAQVRERVAMVAGVAEQVLEQARGLSRLEDLLRPPQARGALGELLLEQLLAQGLPNTAYRTQHVFRSGARVDAVLVVGEAMVAVDSKFPLDAFARMSTAADGDAARTLHRRAFVRDARRHVDAIADKYICPDEGTYDFALCYLPSEAVFYEFLREDPPGDSCWRYAVERRVFPASPTTLYAYLVSIGVGLKGLRVEENARRVLDALAALRGDLDGFRTHFELVGRHLGRARDRWQDAAHRLDRFDGRLAEAAGRATDLDRGLPEPGPEAETGTGLTGTG